MFFCPRCGNLLLAEEADIAVRFYCQTCPYLHNVREVVTKGVRVNKKTVDDVLGGKEAWKNVDTEAATCPKCANERAYVKMMQIRSADEPSTIFYKCTKCAHDWSEW